MNNIDSNILEIEPLKKEINCEINVPGSKSYTNRALVISSLTNGISELNNFLFSDDTNYMLMALENLGIELKVDKTNKKVTIKGNNGVFKTYDKEIFLGNAGTAVRFITALLTLGNGKYIVTGDERMKQRPIQDLIDSINNLGGKVSSLYNNGCPPLEIYGKKLSKNTTTIKGNLSSQYLSAILMIAPYSENDINIIVEGELVSKPYIDMTIDIMKSFGVDVINNNYQSFVVRSNQKYKNIIYNIEVDASNSSYFAAAAAITKGRIILNNVNPNSKQGDFYFLNILKEMGCEIKFFDNKVEIIGKDLKGIEIDMNNMSDVVQTLAIVGLFAKGKTYIKNVYNMRIKETDRIKALYNELTKIGAKVIELEDGLIIEPLTDYKKYNPAEIETYNDHRMAMSFALCGLKIKGIKIKNPNCVSKTFPDYFNVFRQLYQS